MKKSFIFRQQPSVGNYPELKSAQGNTPRSENKLVNAPISENVLRNVPLLKSSEVVRLDLRI